MMQRKALAHLIHSLYSSIAPAYAPLALVVENLDGVAAEHKALYKQGEGGKYRLDVDGLEDNGALKRALETERENAKTAKREARETAEKFKDVDPNKYREWLSRFENDEELKLLSEGKHDVVFEKRTEKMRQSYETQLKKKDEEIGTEQSRTKKYRDRVLDNAVRAAATKAGIHAHAVEDSLLRARQVFVLDDDANAVSVGKDNRPVMGKTGKPYSPDDWFEEMKEAAPHWFPAGSTGSGASSEKGGAGSAKTMKRASFDGLDQVSRAKFIKEGGKVVD